MAFDAKINELQQLELLKELTLDELEPIAPYFQKRTYKKNQTIYSAQSGAHHFIFVLSGKIKIFRLSELGKEQIIRLIEAKEFTGELALFEGVRKAYAETLEASEIFTINHEHFKTVLSNHPKLSLKMIEILASRLHLSEEQTAWLSTSAAKDRLWIYLNKEAEVINGKRIVNYKQTKRFLAAFLGMSSETLSRVLHQLESEGKISQSLDQYIELLDD